MTPQENVHEKTAWDTWAEDYRGLKIKHYFGLSIDEFFDRGRFEATELLRKAKAFMVDDSNRAENASDAVEALFNKDS